MFERLFCEIYNCCMKNLNKTARSYNMSQIRSKNTSPEMHVRRFLHSNGLRYSLHKKSLPGKPDIYLKKHNTAVFINGCFWHMHEGCPKFVMPKTRTDWWERKLSRNRERDEQAIRDLKDMGYNVIVVWECEINTIAKRDERLPMLVQQINSNLVK